MTVMEPMKKKELILAQAEKLFAEKGYYGLGLAELLKRCKTPKGSFYYYFPGGKIQLLQETLEYGYQQMAYGITHRILVLPTALASFERMADHLAKGISEGGHFASLFLSMISIESVYLDKCIHQTCKRLYQQWQQLYAERLAGYGYDERECVEKAQAIFALIHGSMISSWIKQDPADLLLAKATLKTILGDR